MNKIESNIHFYEAYFENLKSDGISKIITSCFGVIPIYRYLLLCYEKVKLAKINDLVNRVKMQTGENLETEKINEVAKKNFAPLTQDQYLSFLMMRIEDDRFDDTFRQAFKKLDPESQKFFFSQVVKMDTLTLDLSSSLFTGVTTNLFTKDELYNIAKTNRLSNVLKMETLSKVLEALPNDIKNLHFNCGSDTKKNFEAAFVFISHLNNRFSNLENVELNFEDMGYYTSSCQTSTESLAKSFSQLGNIGFGNISETNTIVTNGYGYKNHSGRIIGISLKLFEVLNERQFQPKNLKLQFKGATLEFNQSDNKNVYRIITYPTSSAPDLNSSYQPQHKRVEIKFDLNI
jgi:hypothetical protein